MSQSTQISRRRFLKSVGAVGLGSAALSLAACAAPSGTPSADGGSAAAAPSELKILMWSHFVPSNDEWFDEWATGWGAENGAEIVIDHIPHLEIAARAAAEVSAQEGHDIVEWNQGTSSPFLWKSNVIDLSDLVAEIEEKHGPYAEIGRQGGFDSSDGTWFALPNYYIRFPVLYRKDLWESIGMPDGPDTWDDVLAGGTELKAQGFPIGFGLAHSADPNVTWRALLWCYGGSVQDKEGNVVINSEETVAAVEMATALYNDCMTDEVLAWDDASNNRFLASKKGSLIHNPISAYRSIQGSDTELADLIAVAKTPAGPERRLSGAPLLASTIWKFSEVQETALSFLSAWTDVFTDNFVASTGYNHPANSGFVADPMPILSNDEGSNPPDKLSVLQTANEWHATFGWPGVNSAAIGEINQNFVIPDMIAQAATGQMSAQEAVDWAEKQCNASFEKWASA